MRKKRFRYGFLLVVLCILFAASLRAPPPIVGATIQTSTYGVAKNRLTVRIVNASQKDITAFDLLLKITYPSGVGEYHVR